MRSKLFLAFFAVILTALLSNLIFERLIIEDFDEYAEGRRQDELYLILASVEGSFSEGRWDIESLANALHWAMMLGFEAEVRDKAGEKVLTSEESLMRLGPAMKRRMSGIVHHEGAQAPQGEFEEYPLYTGGEEIGSLNVRPLDRAGHIKEKEGVFKRRGRSFLFASFVIAGGGALFLSLILSAYLTNPVRRLKAAAEAVASGDLDVRVKAVSKDEIGRLTETFNRMVETLQREAALRRHLTSNIAHELRTPLAVMRASVEAVSDGVMEDGGEALKDIALEVKRLIRLVEGIEDITRAEASFFAPARREAVELGGFLDDMARGMKAAFSEKGLEIRIEGKGPLSVMADRERLEIIVRNLLSNSLRYTEKGGVRIDYGQPEGEFFVEVADTGRGIPEEELPLVFRRFWRGGASDEGGVGLGLSIVKELSDAMGGRIEIESRPGEGTKIRVFLPAGEKT